jgi:hypothetical protein
MIFRPSGGLHYHWRALRRRNAWRPFARAVENWLAAWSCPRNELVLIGPSAGYTLPTAWLKSFDRVIAYDLDPLAPWIFRRRHRGVRARFERRDVFWRDGRLSTDALSDILRRHGKATILFTNVLGQVLLEGQADEQEWKTFLKELRLRLHGRAWASYHDTFTHENGEIIDHLLTGDWSRGLHKTEFRWELTERSAHVVEGVRPA